MTSDSQKIIDNLFKRLMEEILPVFEKGLVDGKVLFSNPHIVECWKVLDCKSTDCPIYNSNSKPVRCWQFAGTYCNDKYQGSFMQKYEECYNCKAFKDSCPTIVEEIGEHLNNMIFLLNKKEQKILGDKQHIERLNQKLSNLLKKLHEKSREIQEIMITDNLTRLYNRHHLATVLEDEIARCHRYGHSLAIMMIDIDNFKSFNDDYGRPAGDKMLSFAGTLIKENIRKFDRAFRYGGEEFVVVLPETDLTLAYIVAERIRKSFQNKSFTVSRKESTSEEFASRTMSIGITSTFTYTTNTIEIEELINQTDKALSQAKEKGGNISVRYE